MARAWLLALCGLVLAAGAAGAHRLNAAQTVIELNPRSGALEIVHEVFLHDLDHALTRRLGRPPRFETGSADIPLALELLTRDFVLTDESGAVRDTVVVGAERDHDRLIVYQELAEPGPLTALRLSNRMLMADFPEQTNRVNVTVDGTVHTLIFRASDGGAARLLIGE